MERVDLCYHSSCNPSISFIVSSLCYCCSSTTKQAKPVSPSTWTWLMKTTFLLFSNQNNNKGLGSVNHSSQLCWYHGCCIKCLYCHYKHNTIQYLLDHKELLFQHPQHLSMTDLRPHLKHLLRLICIVRYLQYILTPTYTQTIKLHSLAHCVNP